LRSCGSNLVNQPAENKESTAMRIFSSALVGALLLNGVLAYPQAAAASGSIAWVPASIAISAVAAPKEKEESQKKADSDAPKKDAPKKEAAEAKPAEKGDEAAQKKNAPEKSDDKAATKNNGEAEKDEQKKAKDQEKSKGKDEKTAGDKEPEQAKLVVFTINGPYPEKPSSPGPFGSLQPSLSQVVERLDNAAGDDDVHAVLLKIEPAPLGPAAIAELRAAVDRVQEHDKPVYAEIESAMGLQYTLACGCDEVVMPPSGMLSLTGVRAEVTFFKGLLEKLGVDAEFLQMGKYKGAGEPYSRTEMSPPLRQSMEAVVDSLYEDLVRVVADDRGMETYRVKTLIDEGFFTAPAAKKAGLIDRTAYRDELEETIRKRLGAEELDVVTRYRKKEVEVDFSGFSGMVKLMELMFDGDKKPEKKTGKKIAVVYAEGMIVPGKPSRGLFGSEAIGSTGMVKALETAAEDEDVVAIVFRVNSPGGSSVASDVIWREIVEIEKPVIASMSSVAASGGYYIAMGADKILATPGTITGSIGVIGGKLVLGGLYDKLGLNTQVISRGKMNGVYSPTEPFSPEERATLMRQLKAVYRDFVSKAAKGRDMKYDELEKLAQGRIYTGSMAVANGLVDRVGTLHDAVAEAKKAAGLEADDQVELMILPRPRTIFEELFGTGAVNGPMGRTTQLLLSPLADAELWRALLRQPVLVVLPLDIQVR
jgi:protease-4